MAGLFSSLKNLADGFFMEEEDTDDLPELERDKPVPAGALPVRSIRPLELVTMVPGEYRDAGRSADALAKGLVVVVLLGDNVDSDTAKRFVDFLAGAVYLTHGDIELLNDNVLIITPDTVRVERDTFIPVSDIPMWKGPQG